MRQDRSLGLVELRFLVAATGEKPVEERMEAEQGRQQQRAAIKIPNVGGTHQRARQQAQPVDDDMTLFAIDLLSSVYRLDRCDPPFLVPLTLCLPIAQGGSDSALNPRPRHIRVAYSQEWIITAIDDANRDADVHAWNIRIGEQA
jgi:hypothetical protein